MLAWVLKYKNVCNVFECYIEPVLVYRCESWTTDRQLEGKILAAEMWFLRRMLRESCKERTTNDQVLCEANTDRKLLNKIKYSQCKFMATR
jgi:hypothetical protein